jgi:hypothetical protein
LKNIPTGQLKLSDVPTVPIDWGDDPFVSFALSFDGYGLLGDELGECSNFVEKLFGTNPRVLEMFNTTGLRALLFFAQRKARWTDEPYVSDFARGLTEAIRKRLRHK